MTRFVVAFVFLAGLVAAQWAAAAPATYTFDKTHTEIRFQWNHVGLSNQSGRFTKFDGKIVFDKDDVAASSLDVTIDPASVTTTVPKLDDHLRSADYFNTDKHKTITFKSKRVVKTGVRTGQVVGDLTINGKTKPVVLEVTFNFEGIHPLSPFLEAYKDAYYTGFSAHTTVLRSEFGLGRSAPLVSDEILITIETELRRSE